MLTLVEPDTILGLHAPQDSELIRADWTPAHAPTIAGVHTKPITPVLTNNGCLTEIWRADWGLDSKGVGQVFQRVLDAGGISAWHAHKHTTDRLFCAAGRLLLVLYDARPGSPTRGQVLELRMGRERPALVVVPPGVWHGVRNLGGEAVTLINAVDLAYDYVSPDHYRLAIDDTQIPYHFA
jgi:dTDP-4-dehydrorhamnose 3,5-epimerase